jgi:hypothetical protein
LPAHAQRRAGSLKLALNIEPAEIMIFGNAMLARAGT